MKKTSSSTQHNLLLAFAFFAFCLFSSAVYAQEPLQKEVPNIFTPNGDGVNDFLELESTQPMTLQVFNRAGDLVYRITAKRIVWDGRDERGLTIADGVYYYHLNDPAQTYTSSRGFFYISRTPVKAVE